MKNVIWIWNYLWHVPAEKRDGKINPGKYGVWENKDYILYVLLSSTYYVLSWRTTQNVDHVNIFIRNVGYFYPLKWEIFGSKVLPFYTTMYILHFHFDPIDPFKIIDIWPSVSLSMDVITCWQERRVETEGNSSDGPRFNLGATPVGLLLHKIALVENTSCSV